MRYGKGITDTVAVWTGGKSVSDVAVGVIGIGYVAGVSKISGDAGVGYTVGTGAVVSDDKIGYTVTESKVTTEVYCGKSVEACDTNGSVSVAKSDSDGIS